MPARRKGKMPSPRRIGCQAGIAGCRIGRLCLTRLGVGRYYNGPVAVSRVQVPAIQKRGCL